MKCSLCGKTAAALFRCGYSGPPTMIGCRQLACESCCGGLIQTGSIRRPVCKVCARILEGSEGFTMMRKKDE